MGSWLETPPGLYVLRWELERLDHAVTDAFGFHAVQLGLPCMDALRANRMPHRWLAHDSMVLPETLPTLPPADTRWSAQPLPQRVHLHCEFDALPFPDSCIDLVVLPHTLELTRDAHQTLREVERVLVPEGRVVITGFNPVSLWGLRQRAGHARRGVGMARGDVSAGLFLPRAGEFLGYWRLRDWLRLLGLEVDGGCFGCWRPPLHSQRWLQRWAWMDPVGERWWPVLGAVYAVTAVKRVRGMRMVGLLKDTRRLPRAVAVAAQRRVTTPAPQPETACIETEP